MGMVHRAIWYFRARGNSISKRAERYIIEEVEEVLFPYGEDDHGMESIFHTVWDYVDGINAGEINVYKSIEERILERYEFLKGKYLRLLDEMNGSEDDEPPF